ncbi:hypothetical protein BGX34_002330 [Mortierella sp. NVP85]|nr:hypothetical protein BGX34_002330 [Mortierella sp. NVP85]
MVVITYCVEYAQSQKSVCQKCNKVIPNKSLRFGRMERQSEKEKKKFAKYTWYHFRCFEVPEVLTKIPIHLIRGQVDLLDKDKLRLERVLKLGVGGSWSQIVEQHQKKTKSAGGEEELDEEGNPISTDIAMDVEKDDDEDEDDGTGSKAKDFTAQLTGQADRHRKQKHNNNKKQNPLKPNTKGAKVDKTSKQKPGAGAAGKGHPSKDAKGPSKGKDAGKPMSAVEKAIAQSRAQSKKKLEQIQSKFGKK